MKSTQKLIELIKNGDAIAILAEDSLIEGFNELLKYDLMDIVDDKIILTPKGEKAMDIGLDNILSELKAPEHQKFFKNYS
ncbi:MAG TPA: hypothetical protein VIM94_04675 [Salegentibacter sp.]|uniref:hypothetical protein n=1 Tax=Salegentibacter sp. TaxID=1903072 RepID=UPI002F9520DA